MAKDNWVEVKEEPFTNPYNFVPFRGKCEKYPLMSYGKNQKLLTGYFECQAKLLTPLCIPNTSSEAALIPKEQGKSFDFYSYKDLRGKDWEEIRNNPAEPVLPASEIRGVSRSTDEAGFNGCVSTADIKQRLERRSPFLHKGGIGREVFYRTVHDVLEAQGGYQPCISREHVCPVCALYGMISGQEGKPDGCGSRVRFTDGVLEDSEHFDKSWFYNNGEPVVLPPMGEPRIGAVEFYTEVPDIVRDEKKGAYKYWTYDYYVDEDEKGKSVKKPLQKITFRGRKFYWHQDFDESKFGRVDGDKKLGKMEQAVRLLAPRHDGKDTIFRFRVYFEKITAQELQRLRWSLTLAKGTCAQKIGHGKPLGLGSVKMILAPRVHLRTISPEDGQWKMESKTWDEVLSGQKIKGTKEMETLQTILNWRDKPGDVSYPKGDDGSGKENSQASHQWFAGNRAIKAENAMRPNFYKVLPEPEAEIKATKTGEQKEEEVEDMWLYKMLNNKEK